MEAEGGRGGKEGGGWEGGGEEGRREGEGREGKGGWEGGREVAFRGLSERPEARRAHNSPSCLNIDEVDTDAEEKE